MWASALGRSDGVTRPGPTVVLLAGTTLSRAGLAHAARTLPTGTASAVWVGIGAAVTIAWSMVAGRRYRSPPGGAMKRITSSPVW